jgi:hypothetical protein
VGPEQLNVHLCVYLHPLTTHRAVDTSTRMHTLLLSVPPRQGQCHASDISALKRLSMSVTFFLRHLLKSASQASSGENVDALSFDSAAAHFTGSCTTKSREYWQELPSIEGYTFTVKV